MRWQLATKLNTNKNILHIIINTNDKDNFIILFIIPMQLTLNITIYQTTQVYSVEV